MHRKYTASRLLARLASILHPFDEWRQTPALIRCLELLQNGQYEEAQVLLDGLSVHDNSISRAVVVLQVQVSGDWERYHRWMSEQPNLDRLLGDGNLASTFITSLGEMHRPSEMLHLFNKTRNCSALRSHLYLSLTRLRVLALCGKIATVESLLDGPLLTHREAREYWLATAEQAAGETDSATQRFTDLLSSPDQLLVRQVHRVDSTNRYRICRQVTLTKQQQEYSRKSKARLFTNLDTP